MGDGEGGGGRKPNEAIAHRAPPNKIIDLYFFYTFLLLILDVICLKKYILNIYRQWIKHKMEFKMF